MEMALRSSPMSWAAFFFFRVSSKKGSDMISPRINFNSKVNTTTKDNHKLQI